MHEVIPEEPFELLLSNFSKVERRLSKGMVIASAAPSPLALIPLAGKAAKEMAQVLNIAPIEVVLCKWRRNGATYTERPRAGRPVHRGPIMGSEGRARGRSSHYAESPATGSVREPTGAPLPKDLKDLVDLSHITNDTLKARILDILASHKDMWSGDLGEIRATEHHIDLRPDTRPLHQHPYRAGPESRKVLEDHMNLQLATDVIEPAQSDAPPLISAFSQHMHPWQSASRRHP